MKEAHYRLQYQRTQFHPTPLTRIELPSTKISAWLVTINHYDYLWEGEGADAKNTYAVEEFRKPLMFPNMFKVVL
jgi:hypothetical protein